MRSSTNLSVSSRGDSPQPQRREKAAQKLDRSPPPNPPPTSRLVLGLFYDGNDPANDSAAGGTDMESSVASIGGDLAYDSAAGGTDNDYSFADDRPGARSSRRVETLLDCTDAGRMSTAGVEGTRPLPRLSVRRLL